VASARGKHREAADELRKIAKVRSDALGADNPDVLITRNYLAEEHRHLGKLAEAEAEHRDVIVRRTRALGAAHPDTLMSRNNLALTLQDLGRLAEAAEEHLAVYHLRAGILGPDHPYTHDSYRCYTYLAKALRTRSGNGRVPPAGAGGEPAEPALPPPSDADPEGGEFAA
jgi:Tetratricopeptide repeat